MAIPYYIFAWIASALFAFEAITAKLASKYLIQNPWMFNFVWSLAILIFTVPLAIHYGATVPDFSWNLILAGFFTATGGILYIICLYKMDISVLSPLYNFRTWFAVILGAVFLHEILTGWQYALIAAMFIAGIFSVLDESWNLKAFFTKNVGLAMVQMLLLAMMALFINKSVNQLGFWTATLWITIIAQAILLLTVPMFWKDIFKINRRQLAVCCLVAIAGTFANIVANKAYRTNIGLTSVILSVPLSMIVAYALSVFAPKLLEKHTHKVYLVRFAAAAFMIIGAIKLTR